ncbi:MAG: signal peptidase I [Bacilli bacterium]|nr:signal peptidase I [Bacilli bacterium]
MESAMKNSSFKDTLKYISTIISWTVFTLLMICAALLFYYFVSMNIYALKGDKFEPKFSLYTIMSGSMIPNIDVYDVIVNLRVDDPEKIKIGDVITFESISTESYGTTVTHRVVGIVKDDEGNYSYQTKGDNNLIADSSAVPYSNVIGRVSIRIPQLGRIQLFVASSLGWLCLVLIPCLYILLKGLLKRLAEEDAMIKQKNLVVAQDAQLSSDKKLKLPLWKKKESETNDVEESSTDLISVFNEGVQSPEDLLKSFVTEENEVDTTEEKDVDKDIDINIEEDKKEESEIDNRPEAKENDNEIDLKTMVNKEVEEETDAILAKWKREFGVDNIDSVDNEKSDLSHLVMPEEEDAEDVFANWKKEIDVENSIDSGKKDDEEDDWPPYM